MLFSLIKNFYQVRSRRYCQPAQLIFFVTSRCNSRCKTCFYWKELNQQQELSLSEISKLAANFKNLTSLAISGGEPFLREDLAEICRIFANQSNVQNISIPTNGQLTEKIYNETEKILNLFPRRITISLSLDGFAETHDFIRGVPGGYNQSLETLKKLSSLKEKYKNLNLNVCSVLCNKNVKEVPDLLNFIADLGFVDTHNIEFIRGEPLDKSFQMPEPEKIKNICQLRKSKIPHQSKIKEKALQALKKTMWDYQEKSFLNQERLVPCYAGKFTCVVYPEGEVALCELKPTVGNLRKSDFNLKKILTNELAKRQMEEAQKNCFCQHGLFLKNNILFSPKTYFRLLRNFLQN